MAWFDTDKPRIACEVTFEDLTPTVCLVRTELSAKIVSGELASMFLYHLNGMNSICDLLRKFPEVSRETLLGALDLLESERMLTRSEPEALSKEETAYWRLAGATEEHITTRRAESQCAVMGIGESIDIQIAANILKGTEIRITEDAPFRLVIARDVFDVQLHRINEQCLKQGTGWLLIRPFGRRHWIGPLFLPRITPCWQCLCWWLVRNGWSSNYIVANWGVQTSATIALGTTQAARWLLSGKCDAITGRILEFDTATLEFRQHALLPSPTCLDCAPIRTGMKVQGESTLSPLLGVTASVELLHESPGLAIATGTGSQVVGFDGSGRRYYCRRQSPAGVGETPSRARAICLAEGVERYSARYGGFESSVAKGDPWLSGNAVRPEELLHAFGPGSFHPEEITSWTPALSLVSRETCFVPAGLVYLSFDERFGTDTNGCAAGDTLNDATLSGLLELIERDAVALWWYNRVRRPVIDVDALGSKRINAIIDAIERSRFQVDVLDITTDFRVSACVAIARSQSHCVAMGFAAHPNPERAAWKAMAEMSLGVLRLAQPASDCEPSWVSHITAQEIENLIDHQSPVKWHVEPKDDVTDLLPSLIDSAKRLSLDVLRVDLTRPELAIPVVRIFVPGLRSLHRCLAPGRLYEVPVKLGWLPCPLRPEEINPTPLLP